MPTEKNDFPEEKLANPGGMLYLYAADTYLQVKDTYLQVEDIYL